MHFKLERSRQRMSAKTSPLLLKIKNEVNEEIKVNSLICLNFVFKIKYSTEIICSIENVVVRALKLNFSLNSCQRN